MRETEKHAGLVLSTRPEFWLQGAATLANAVLVIALAYVLAGLTVAILWNQPLLSVGTMALAPGGPTASETSISQSADYAAIGAWHLFGQVDTAQPVALPHSEQRMTPLNLRLAGIFFIQRDRGRALALIAEGTGLERGYRIGESLPGGATLEDIQRDRVVVSRNGQQEVLDLPKLDSVKKAPVPAAAPLGMPPQPGMPPEPEIPLEPEPPEPEMPLQPDIPPQSSAFRDQRTIDARAVASRLRDAVLNRPQALEDIAFASPYIRNGQFLGFRLRPGRDRQLMGQLGLNSGDVLTEVNGSRLDNPMQGLAMLRELMSADQINVRVLRSGTEIPLSFSLGRPAIK